MDLDGKKMVITGAASGIGKCLMRELSQCAGQLVVADIDAAALQEAESSPGMGKALLHPFVGDLSRQQCLDDLFTFCMEKMQGIDIFIANAGFAFIERIEKADWEHIEDIFRLNVFSPIYSLEKMAELHPGSDFGMVITSSALGRIALDGYSLYASTKAALDRFADGYRRQMGNNAKLLLAYPLATRSNFYRSAGGAPIPWPSQTPEQVARAIVRGMMRDREEIYASTTLRLMLATGYILPFTNRLYQHMESFRFQRWIKAAAKT
jgi:short-subunit dehydrogenase